MGAIQEIFRLHGPAYLARFGARMPGEHKKVIEAIIGCASPANGSLSYGCESCAEQSSCCRAAAATVTVRAASSIRPMPGWTRNCSASCPRTISCSPSRCPHNCALSSTGDQRIGYGALFEASAGAIKKLTPDPKYIGADCPGFLGVLHTWGRQLQYHPHIHYLVPGGALSSQDRRWHASSPGFYLPVLSLTLNCNSPALFSRNGSPPTDTSR